MMSREPAEGQLQLPPGFRFYPSDEELVVHYLSKKAASQPFAVPIIAEVDLYKFNPWDLPEKALFGEKEWYFFSPRDRKYPNGCRPNRAAGSGYWKATGTDKPIRIHGSGQKVGAKKSLVFYVGKPPKGDKTKWIMHEYCLADSAAKAARRKGSLRLDDWVLCRIYKKLPSAMKLATMKLESGEEDGSEEVITSPREMDDEKPVNLQRLSTNPLLISNNESSTEPREGAGYLNFSELQSPQHYANYNYAQTAYNYNYQQQQQQMGSSPLANYSFKSSLIHETMKPMNDTMRLAGLNPYNNIMSSQRIHNLSSQNYGSPVSPSVDEAPPAEKTKLPTNASGMFSISGTHSFQPFNYDTLPCPFGEPGTF